MTLTDAFKQFKIQNKFNKLLSEIRPNPYQPRKEFDEEGLAELAELSVKWSLPTNHQFVSHQRHEPWSGNVVRASKLAERNYSGHRTTTSRNDDSNQYRQKTYNENLKPLDEAMVIS